MPTERVCEKSIPIEKVREQKPKAEKPGFYLDAVLKETLDTYIKNVKNDWDFVLVISGEGEVRVGKSFLASQIAQYWVDKIEEVYGIKVPWNLKENFVFDGDNLISKGNKLGKNYSYPPLIFDEAGADLEGTKAMKRTTQNVKDYLRECGQYNMLTILVLPEFFDLPKGIAINRTDGLINTYWLGDPNGYMDRGYFKFYSRPNKKQLYINGKKFLNYNAWSHDFRGRFDNLFPLDLDEYKRLKKQALSRRERGTAQERRHKDWLQGFAKICVDDHGMSYRELAREVSKKSKTPISFRQIGTLLGRDKESED